MNSKQFNALLKSPKAMIEYHTTGRLPRVPDEPKSPLITLLKSLTPRERLQIVGLTVGRDLGYEGSRTFANAAQALNWLVPAGCSAHLVSESWRTKRFQQQLTIEDLAKHSSVPEEVQTQWLRRNR